MHHNILGGVPRIHQNSPEWQAFIMEGIIEHILHMIEFGFAITVGIINSPINNPILVGV
jgi:hypothetical protein